MLEILLNLEYLHTMTKNKQYDIWSKQLSQAWGNQDLSKDSYDYRKYYNDQPIVAWL